MKIKRNKPPRWKKPLRLANIEDIPDNAVGVYGFWCRTTGRCIYIGKAEKQSIQKRIKQEWKNSHNDGLKSWIKCFAKYLDVCYLSVSHGNLSVTTSRRIDRLETRLIRMWNPETNLSKKRT